MDKKTKDVLFRGMPPSWEKIMYGGKAKRLLDSIMINETYSEEELSYVFQGLTAELDKANIIVVNGKYQKIKMLDNWVSAGVIRIDLTPTDSDPLLWKDYMECAISRINVTLKKNDRPVSYVILGNFNISTSTGHTVIATNLKNYVDEVNELLGNSVENSELLQKDTDSPPKIFLEQFKFSFDKGPRTNITFTDGSCFPNKSCPDSRGGYASIFTKGPFVDKKLYGAIAIDKEFATNIRAEGFAILAVLNHIEKYLDVWDDTIIITDCKFWQTMINETMRKWHPDVFREKKNSDLTTAIWEKWCDLKEIHKKKLRILHMYSHNKKGWKNYPKNSYQYYCYIQNEYADIIAKLSRGLPPGTSKIGNVKYK
jgi:ribonuclease HI